MTVRTYQYLLGSAFFGHGRWYLFAPVTVMGLTIRTEYQSAAPIVPILTGAFSAQALIAGHFAAFSTFTKPTFAAYGIGLLPFSVFDHYFYAFEPMLTWIGLLDAVGNVAMLALSAAGWKAAGRSEGSAA